jgi:hypothetical protein
MSKMVNHPSQLQSKKLLRVFPFAFAIFLSAFLLFQIQPLISRYILPWFGGTPSLWSVSLLFFQTLLLGGYAFAHWLSSRKKWQLSLYLALLVISVGMLLFSALWWESPLLPGDNWKPTNIHQPFLRIALILLVSVGLPYFLLSTTSPLLQSWFKIFNQDRSPYRLYALSNFGSFLGLISYPFIFEPLFRLREQAWFWSAFYFVYIGLCFYLGLKVFLSKATKSQDQKLGNVFEFNLVNDRSIPDKFQKIFWISVAACTSILLLSVTNQLTQEVAVIPFLWVLPLSIYLFSFMVTFSGKKGYQPKLYISFLALTTLGVGYALNAYTSTGMLFQIVLLSSFLLFSTLVCHGELYRSKPDSEYLTSFYLYISLGGVIGGLFVNLVAPVIFSGYWELHLGIILCWILVIASQFRDRSWVLNRRLTQAWIIYMVIVLGISSYLFIQHIDNTLSGVLQMERNFYGVIRVRSIGVGDPPESAFSLNHGTTSHGFQFREEERRTIPTSYYGTKSGVGLAIKYYRETLNNTNSQLGLKIGLVGLGIGTLAAYGEDQDQYRFYEINPDIIDLALGKNNYFSYLVDSPSLIQIIPGDARISLENELKNGNPQKYDILAVDAFSSDAIPIHLLTVEALDIYHQHLKPEGILAIHLSNRYLNLVPLARRLADHYQMESALIRNSRDNTMGSYPSSWILLSKNQAFFHIPEILNNTIPPNNDDPIIRIWSDDYSNLVPLIKTEVFTKIH